MSRVFAISGIDTDIGKSVATGCIARGLLECGQKVITVKAVQTGCTGMSEDIILHRRYMGIEPLNVDMNGSTCPFLFSKPCSPHLAASLENDRIDSARITRAVDSLQNDYDVILVEGAGGLFVPLTEELLMIDYFKSVGWPMILVTSARLGSINHTLASLEAIRSREMALAGIVYNCHDCYDGEICVDSLAVIKKYTEKYGFTCPVIEMATIETMNSEGFIEFADLCK